MRRARDGGGCAAPVVSGMHHGTKLSPRELVVISDGFVEAARLHPLLVVQQLTLEALRFADAFDFHGHGVHALLKLLQLLLQQRVGAHHADGVPVAAVSEAPRPHAGERTKYDDDEQQAHEAERGFLNLCDEAHHLRRHGRRGEDGAVACPVHYELAAALRNWRKRHWRFGGSHPPTRSSYDRRRRGRRRTLGQLRAARVAVRHRQWIHSREEQPASVLEHYERCARIVSPWEVCLPLIIES